MDAFARATAALKGSLLASTLAAGVIVALLIGGLVLLWRVFPAACAQALQLAGDPAAYEAALTGPCQELADADGVAAALRWDLVFAVAYALGLALVCWLGAQALYEGRPRRLAGWGGVAALAAGAADVAENTVLLAVDATGDTGLLWASQGAGLLKWVALAPALLVAVVVTATLVGRSLRYLAAAPTLIPTWPPAAATPTDQDSGEPDHHLQRVWQQNYQVPPPARADASQAERGRVGVALSGGGIRSATFALGATQVLAEHGLLQEADYVASVSSGGYHAGSQQMLRARAQQARRPVGLAEAFAPGTPEEDHRRRHGKYIAAGTASTSPPAPPAGCAPSGRSPGTWRSAPRSCTPGSCWRPGCSPRGTPRSEPWSAPLLAPLPQGWRLPAWGPGTLAAVTAPVAIALAAWLVAGIGAPAGSADPAGEGRREGRRGGRWGSLLRLLAGSTAALAALAAAVLLGGPLLVSVIRWLPHAPFAPEVSLGQAAAGGGLLALATTVWNMLSSNRDAVAKAAGRARKALAGAEFATRALLSFVIVAGLVVAAVLVFGAELTQAVDAYLSAVAGAEALTPTADGRLLVAAAVLAAASALFDQTRTMSLHPFYKRRLATSFAIERTASGAGELDYRIPTLLSAFAAPTPDTAEDSSGAQDRARAGPQLLQCAAANVSGTDLAPPGRKVTPVVFSHDWVGGPRLGYLSTGGLEEPVAGRAYRGVWAATRRGGCWSARGGCSWGR